MAVLTLRRFRPAPRYDAKPWTHAELQESTAAADGPWAAIDSFTFGSGGQPAADIDPTNPAYRDFTTENAGVDGGWYRIVFIDVDGDRDASDPVATFPPTLTSTIYTNPEAVRDVLASGADREGTAASLPEEQIDAAIRDAQAQVDAKVPGAPFTGTVPDVVANLTRDIAAYLATLTYRKGRPLVPDEPAQRRYTARTGYLGTWPREGLPSCQRAAQTRHPRRLWSTLTTVICSRSTAKGSAPRSASGGPASTGTRRSRPSRSTEWARSPHARASFRT
jgi:hypothetical protein